MNWILSFVWPAGRVGRPGFWLGWLLLWGVQLALTWGSTYDPRLGTTPLPSLVWQVGSAVLLWAGFCLRARRLHDFDGTAFWLAIPVVAMLVGGGLAIAVVTAFWSFGVIVAVPLIVLALAVLLIFDVVIGSKRTTGPDGLPIAR